MKNSKIIATFLIIVATSLLLSCKKEKNLTSFDDKITLETQASLNYIHQFQKLRNMRDSINKSEGNMTLKEMQQTLCLVANLEHSEHQKRCVHNVLDTLYISMPTIDGDGNVSNMEVIDTYDSFEKALQDCLDNINDGKNIVGLFSIMLPQVGANDSDSIQIVFTRGQEFEESGDSPIIEGPIEDICLVWGLNGGFCNPTPPINILWDAADELSTYFVPNVTNPGNGSYQVFSNVEYVEYIATNTFMVNNPYFSNYTYWTPSQTITPCNNWLFYLSGILNGPEPCLCEDEMNCEWFNINQFIVEEDGDLHLSPNFHSPYYSCEVKDNYLWNKVVDMMCDRYHTALVCYADYYWVLPNPD